MKTKYIIIGLVIILVIIFLIQKKEHITSSSPPTNLSSEAIQNIAKVYADITKTVEFNNIKTTGNATFKKLNVIENSILNNLNVSGNLIASGDSIISGDSVINGNLDVNGTAKFKNNSIIADNNGNNIIMGKTLISGDVDIIGNLSTVSSKAKVIEPSAADWLVITQAATKEFKISDPDGTYKIIAFKRGGVNWFTIYIKMGNKVYLNKLSAFNGDEGSAWIGDIS